MYVKVGDRVSCLYFPEYVGTVDEVDGATSECFVKWDARPDGITEGWRCARSVVIMRNTNSVPRLG
jgi:hypothetical protein